MDCFWGEVELGLDGRGVGCFSYWMHVRTDVRPVPGNAPAPWSRAAQVVRDKNNGIVPAWQRRQVFDAGVEDARPLVVRVIDGG